MPNFTHKDIEGTEVVSSTYRCGPDSIPNKYHTVLATKGQYTQEMTDYEKRFTDKVWNYYVAKNDVFWRDYASSCTQCLGQSDEPSWVAYLEDTEQNLLSMTYFGKLQPTRDEPKDARSKVMVKKTRVLDASTGIDLSTCFEIEFIANLDQRDRAENDKESTWITVGGGTRISIGAYTLLWAMSYLVDMTPSIDLDHFVVFCSATNKKMEKILTTIKAKNVPMKLEHTEKANRKDKKITSKFTDMAFFIDMTGDKEAKQDKLRAIATAMGISPGFPRASPAKRATTGAGHTKSPVNPLPSPAAARSSSSTKTGRFERRDGVLIGRVFLGAGSFPATVLSDKR